MWVFRACFGVVLSCNKLFELFFFSYVHTKTLYVHTKAWKKKQEKKGF